MNSPTWAAGIQTCPRPGLRLDQTVNSVRNAGWHEITIFGEPGTTTDQPKIIWPRRFGDWGGWLAAVSCLHSTQPDADYFVMFEDDIALCRNIRPYLETFLHKLPRLGTFHFYTPPKHHRDFGQKPIVTDESHHGWELWGAQGVVFSRASLREFLGDPLILNYRDTPIGKSNAHKDTAIGTWAKTREKANYYQTPSLAQHIRLPSLIGSDHHEAEDFVGEDFDASIWIGNGPSLSHEKIL